MWIFPKLLAVIERDELLDFAFRQICRPSPGNVSLNLLSCHGVLHLLFVAIGAECPDREGVADVPVTIDDVATSRVKSIALRVEDDR